MRLSLLQKNRDNPLPEEPPASTENSKYGGIDYLADESELIEFLKRFINGSKIDDSFGISKVSAYDLMIILKDLSFRMDTMSEGVSASRSSGGTEDLFIESPNEQRLKEHSFYSSQVLFRKFKNFEEKYCPKLQMSLPYAFVEKRFFENAWATKNVSLQIILVRFLRNCDKKIDQMSNLISNDSRKIRVSSSLFRPKNSKAEHHKNYSMTTLPKFSHFSRSPTKGDRSKDMLIPIQRASMFSRFTQGAMKFKSSFGIRTKPPEDKNGGVRGVENCHSPEKNATFNFPSLKRDKGIFSVESVKKLLEEMDEIESKTSEVPQPRTLRGRAGGFDSPVSTLSQNNTPNFFPIDSDLENEQINSKLTNSASQWNNNGKSSENSKIKELNAISEKQGEKFKGGGYNYHDDDVDVPQYYRDRIKSLKDSSPSPKNNEKETIFKGSEMDIRANRSNLNSPVSQVPEECMRDKRAQTVDNATVTLKTITKQSRNVNNLLRRHQVNPITKNVKTFAKVSIDYEQAGKVAQVMSPPTPHSVSMNNKNTNLNDADIVTTRNSRSLSEASSLHTLKRKTKAVRKVRGETLCITAFLLPVKLDLKENQTEASKPFLILVIEALEDLREIGRLMTVCKMWRNVIQNRFLRLVQSRALNYGIPYRDRAGLYSYFTSHALSMHKKGDAISPKDFEGLISKGKSTKYAAPIGRDVPRAFGRIAPHKLSRLSSNNSLLSVLDQNEDFLEWSKISIESKRDVLANVLYTFVGHQSRNEYCQGQERVVGQLISIYNKYMIKNTDLETSRAVYQVFSCLYEGFHLRELYDVDKGGLFVCVEVFVKLFKNLLPKIFEHFSKEDFTLDMVAFGWFQTLFCNVPLPRSSISRLFDWWITSGDFSVFLKFGLAILKRYEDTLLKSEFDEIASILNTLPDSQANDSDLVIQAALSFSFSNDYLIRLEEEIRLQNDYKTEREGYLFQTGPFFGIIRLGEKPAETQ